MKVLAGLGQCMWQIFIFIIMTTFVIGKGGYAMELKSKDFQNNQNIPTVHTCDGRDISPQLSWSGAPPGETKSYALTCIDPDAPMGDFIHWLIYDIPAAATSIPRGGPLPTGAQEVQNDFGKESYGGPCPPSGTHRYFFTIYALNTGQLKKVTKAIF